MSNLLSKDDITKVRYRLYHSEQDGWRHPKDSLRFVFAPERPFKPLGLIIFDPGNSIVERLIIGIEDQLVVPVAATEFSALDFTIGQLELLTQSIAMQSVLNGMGIPSMTLPSVNIGTYINLTITEPVGIVAFWGVERINIYSTE